MAFMRYNIYYRKCDGAPANLFKEKYAGGGIEAQVSAACRIFAGADAETITPLNCDGDHYAYRVKLAGEEMVFRADTSAGDDDYMLAEAAAMRLARGVGVPVPRVFTTDVSRVHVPCRWQLLEWVHGKALVDFDRDKTLDRDAIARQIGTLFRRLHSVPLEGFGFFNTKLLSETGRVRGLYASYPEYFRCRLDDHCRYLLEHALADRDTLKRVETVFEGAQALLDLKAGVLVHRDPAFWNLVGESDRISALIDWDDVVSGDAADDLGLMWCFHDARFMRDVLAAYGNDDPVFARRISLHYLRNMLWKTVIRHRMGYFEKGRDFFLNVAQGNALTLKDVTLNKLSEALERCESSCST